MSKLLIASRKRRAADASAPPFILNKDGSVSRYDEMHARAIYLNSAMACRHGLVCGATGTGKTVTLKVLTEAFDSINVPVIITDVKGDVSGLGLPGTMTPELMKRAIACGVKNFKTEPVSSIGFCDPFLSQDTGCVTAAPLPLYELSSELLARLLGLSQAQAGILDIIYSICEDNRLRLDTLDDLRWMLNYVQSNAKAVSRRYGYVPASSAGVVARSILRLENEGGSKIFSKSPNDVIGIPTEGITVLDCTELAHKPLLYSAYLLWMLNKIYQTLPEVGDCDKPKLVLIFDEAHLIFKDAEKVLLEEVERIIKLIRSKGVSVWFCSQSPTDIPDEILSQLGNRIEHALRAYTPNEQKKVKAAAGSFRTNPDFNTEEVIGELGTGEALISFLDADGIPQVVQRCDIIPPRCSMGDWPKVQRLAS